MKWMSEAIVITTLLWLTGSIGSALAQESPCEPIDLESTNYHETSVARDMYPAKDAPLLCGEMSLGELESVAGKKKQLTNYEARSLVIQYLECVRKRLRI